MSAYLTLCANEGCDRRTICAHWTTTPAPSNSFGRFAPDSVSGRCSHFLHDIQEERDDPKPVPKSR